MVQKHFVDLLDAFTRKTSQTTYYAYTNQFKTLDLD